MAQPSRPQHRRVPSEPSEPCALGAPAAESVFTAGLRLAVEEQVRVLQGLLRLGDWVVRLDWSAPAGDDCYAQITPNENSRHACLQISPLFLGLPEEAQRQTLVHELLHCHVFDLHHCAELMLENCASRSAFRIAAEVLNARVEMLVDGLADVLSPMCPPIPYAAQPPAAPEPAVAEPAVAEPAVADSVSGALSRVLASL